MTIGTDLKTLLNTGIVDTRVYPAGAEEAPVAPYITYSRVSAVGANAMAGNGGGSGLMNTRMQIDVFAKTYSEAQSKAAAVKSALNGWTVQNVVNLEQDFYESDVKLHRVIIDVSTWHTS